MGLIPFFSIVIHAFMLLVGRAMWVTSTANELYHSSEQQQVRSDIATIDGKGEKIDECCVENLLKQPEQQQGIEEAKENIFVSTASHYSAKEPGGRDYHHHSCVIHNTKLISHLV